MCENGFMTSACDQCGACVQWGFFPSSVLFGASEQGEKDKTLQLNMNRDKLDIVTDSMFCFFVAVFKKHIFFLQEG